MFKPDKFSIYRLGNYEATGVIGMYSFLGLSTRILGHANINNRSRDENNGEGLVVNSLS